MEIIQTGIFQGKMIEISEMILSNTDNQLDMSWKIYFENAIYKITFYNVSRLRMENLSAPLQIQDFEIINHSQNGWEDATTQYQDGWENRAEDQFQDNGAGKKDIGFRQNGNSQQTNIWKIIAIILIVLIAAPIILPMGLALMAVLIALIVAALAIVFAIGLAGFAVCFAGGAIIVAGLTKVLLTPAVGILATGIGCLLLAIGILLSWAIISVLFKIVPGMIRGIVKILGTPFRKAGVR